MITSDISSVVSLIEKSRTQLPAEHALLAGISGIDASGKGYISAQIAEALRSKGLRTALINADGWLNLPSVRFAETDNALHFYENALRLDNLFKELILPLRSDRSIRLTADLVHETATEPHQFEYAVEDVDVVLVEGIFLFKRRFVPHFDLRIWVDCSFETALERAVSRAQEDLDEAATITAYKTIYFPAQSIHFELDTPNLAADLIFDNSSNFQH